MIHIPLKIMFAHPFDSSQQTKTDNISYISVHIIHSVVGIATRLWPARSGVRFPAGPRHFSLLQNTQTGSGTHPVGTGWCFTVRKTHHRPPFKADGTNEPSFTYKYIYIYKYVNIHTLPYVPLWRTQQRHLYVLQCKVQQQAVVLYCAPLECS